MLGITPNTLELIALLALLASVFAGFRRIEQFVSLARGNHTLMHMHEESSNLVSAYGPEPVRGTASGTIMSPAEVALRIAHLSTSTKALNDVLAEVGERAHSWYKARNALIALGVVLLLAARLWSAYL